MKLGIVTTPSFSTFGHASVLWLPSGRCDELSSQIGIRSDIWGVIYLQFSFDSLPNSHLSSTSLCARRSPFSSITACAAIGICSFLSTFSLSAENDDCSTVDGGGGGDGSDRGEDG